MLFSAFNLNGRLIFLGGPETPLPNQGNEKDAEKNAKKGEVKNKSKKERDALKPPEAQEKVPVSLVIQHGSIKHRPMTDFVTSAAMEPRENDIGISNGLELGFTMESDDALSMLVAARALAGGEHLKNLTNDELKYNSIGMEFDAEGKQLTLVHHTGINVPYKGGEVLPRGEYVVAKDGETWATIRKQFPEEAQSAFLDVAGKNMATAGIDINNFHSGDQILLGEIGSRVKNIFHYGLVVTHRTTIDMAKPLTTGELRSLIQATPQQKADLKPTNAEYKMYGGESLFMILADWMDERSALIAWIRFAEAGVKVNETERDVKLVYDAAAKKVTLVPVKGDSTTVSISN